MPNEPKTSRSIERPHLLIVRFSSYGDIVQAMGVPEAFASAHPGARVTWLVRDDFRGLLEGHPRIDEVVAFPRRAGLLGLIRTSWQLASRGFTHVYDAHNNVRSHLALMVFRAARLVGRARSFAFVRRSKQRWRRFLFFRFRMKTLPMPFRGSDSFHAPLASWGLGSRVPAGTHFHPSERRLPDAVEVDLERLEGRPLIVLAPSAAWEMKRWPVEHWKSLIAALPDLGFALVGGPGESFIEDIARSAPNRTVNLAGRLSLAESASLLLRAQAVVANDTGLLHVADQMERPALALIGPTAFGYPSHSTSKTIEIDLYCKPCSKDGRGRCVNDLYKRCLVEISPERVAKNLGRLLAESRP